MHSENGQDLIFQILSFISLRAWCLSSVCVCVCVCECVCVCVYQCGGRGRCLGQANRLSKNRNYYCAVCVSDKGWIQLDQSSRTDTYVGN